jgi:hypothetical protein
LGPGTGTGAWQWQDSLRLPRRRGGTRRRRRQQQQPGAGRDARATTRTPQMIARAQHPPISYRATTPNDDAPTRTNRSWGHCFVRCRDPILLPLRRRTRRQRLKNLVESTGDSQNKGKRAARQQPKSEAAEVLTVTRRHGTCESPLGRHWQGRLAAFASGDGVPAMRTQAADRRPPPRPARGRGGARAHAAWMHGSCHPDGGTRFTFLDP